jgi:hypothetical protein
MPLLLTLAMAAPAQAGNCGSLPQGLPDQGPAMPPQGLLVSGTIGPEGGTLNPSFPLPFLPPQPERGAYSLVFRDAQGELLNKIPFDLPPQGGSTGGQEARAFSLVVPYPAALRGTLAAIELCRGEERLDTLMSTHPRPRVAPLHEPPVARPLRPGVVRLTWDPTTHPGAMVKAADTGAELAIAHGGTVDLHTEAKELAVALSDGLRTISRRVAVAP